MSLWTLKKKFCFFSLTIKPDILWDRDRGKGQEIISNIEEEEEEAIHSKLLMALLK